jgi:hypothetical protein
MVLADNPLIYWRLGEVAGATAIDETGHYNGTMTGVELGQPGLIANDNNMGGEVNTSRSFSISAGTIPELNAVASITVECWANLVNFDQWAAYKHLAARGNPFSGYAWGLEGTEIPRFSLHQNQIAHSAIAGNNIWDNGTHHIVGRYDGAEVCIFVDGFKFSEPLSGPSDSLAGFPVEAVPSYLGGIWGINGVVDEIAFYEHALSDERILAHYRKGTGQ